MTPYGSQKDYEESQGIEEIKPHWCSRIRNIDTEFQDKFGEKIAHIDDTQR